MRPADSPTGTILMASGRIGGKGGPWADRFNGTPGVVHHVILIPCILYWNTGGHNMARQSGLSRPHRNRSRRHPAPRDARRLGFEVLEARQMLAAFDVLVFSKTAGFRHDSIDEGMAAIQALGAANDFTVTHTEDAALFTQANLAQYEAVIFLNTTGDVLNAAQQTAFQAYIQAGGGFAGTHSAADTEHGWAWYGQLLGAYFASHPAIQQATIKVADHVHGSTAHLPDRWVRTDEWYNYNVNPRGDVHVLMTLDESTYSPGRRTGIRSPDQLVQVLRRRPVVVHRPGAHGQVRTPSRCFASTCWAASCSPPVRFRPIWARRSTPTGERSTSRRMPLTQRIPRSNEPGGRARRPRVSSSNVAAP